MPSFLLRQFALLAAKWKSFIKGAELELALGATKKNTIKTLS